MLHSKIVQILEAMVKDDEKMGKMSHHFHAIESEIDSMANKPDADIDEILRRAKVLIERLCGAIFVDEKWHGIEKELERNLRELKK